MHLRPFHLALALIGAACGGCALAEDDAAPGQSTEVSAVTPSISAFVLTVTANVESDITVTSPAHVDSCTGGTTCNFAYLQGTALTIQTDAKNLIDCAQFSSWSGACSGQGANCNLTINSNISTSARYKFGIPGCIPQ